MQTYLLIGFSRQSSQVDISLDLVEMGSVVGKCNPLFYPKTSNENIWNMVNVCHIFFYAFDQEYKQSKKEITFLLKKTPPEVL